MSSFALILFLLSMTSMHACSARLLRFYDKENIGKTVKYFTEVAGKEKVSDETSNWLKLKPFVSPVLESQIKTEANKNDVKISHGDCGAKVEPVYGATSGNQITKSNPHPEWQQSIKRQGQKGHARSMLGSASHDPDTEEAVESNENDTVDDIVEMDYAPPHRKPPIHNEKN